MNNWIEEKLTCKPEEFQKISPTTYIQRRNVTQISDEEYTCECRKISVDEFDNIMERRNEIRQVVLDTTNTAAYEDGYQAAMILLGGEE